MDAKKLRERASVSLIVCSKAYNDALKNSANVAVDSVGRTPALRVLISIGFEGPENRRADVFTILGTEIFLVQRSELILVLRC